MKSWLRAANEGPDMGHSMDHGMGGMLDEEEMSALAASSAGVFDKLFLQGMINHHEGALHMVTMIEDSQDPQIRKLGLDITKSQTAEIALMKELLG